MRPRPAATSASTCPGRVKGSQWSPAHNYGHVLLHFRGWLHAVPSETCTRPRQVEKLLPPVPASAGGANVDWLLPV